VSDLILVTGASGFIGARVVDRLLAADATVRVLVRDPARLAPGVRARVACVAGDLRDSAALSRAVAGAHTVLHLAAVARAWVRDEREFAAVNERATAALLLAARRAGVARLVHVSTILTLPPFRAAGLSGEAARLTPYETSKRAAEQLVADYTASGGDAVIVHPTRVLGPGPLTDANAVSRVIALYLAGRFRVRLDDGDVLANYVHVDDVAQGILLAARRGTRGAHYVLGGENASFRGLLQAVAETSGVMRRVLAVPAGAALAAARAAQWWGRLGGTAAITPAWVRIFLEDRRVDVEPVHRALGYTPRGLAAAVGQTVAWLRSGARAAA
jgi:dihydroflavonol-4-reductase